MRFYHANSLMGEGDKVVWFSPSDAKKWLQWGGHLVSRQTVNTDLKDLVGRKILKRAYFKRGFLYSVTEYGKTLSKDHYCHWIDPNYDYIPF